MEKFEGEKFIQTVLVADIQKLIDNGFDYFSFVAIALGIETLGAFFDEDPFEDGVPWKRFHKGLSLMDVKYQPYKNYLWDNLRCGLAHQLKPKNGITLTSYNSIGEVGNQNAISKDIFNLYKGDKTGLIYFVVDTLFKDFKDACFKVIEKINDPTDTEIPDIRKNKVYMTVNHTSFDVLVDRDKITITETR